MWPFRGISRLRAPGTGNADSKPFPGELARRENWTDRTVITIDPASARDFDDAISITATPSGWTLAVHIADVSHFVRPGGALDGEALRRGNSTYLPDRVLPMLPPRLSDDLCSLRPDVVRLTKVCEMNLIKRGRCSVHALRTLSSAARRA
ncbi:MAG: RNB domain-containing ribonuclease [Akkermansia muciniphila]